MAIANTVLAELPYLRRFARSICGRQESGDAYVKAVLEMLVADPNGFPRTAEPRVVLYHALVKVWNSFAANRKPEGAGETTVDRRIENITPLPRQAFLLVAVEGFTTEEAAHILDLSPERLSKALDEAGREIAEQVATNVLIIEDEPLIAMDLEQLVTSIGHSVQDVARTKGEALAAFRKRRPGLILADIQLADGSSGIDAVNEILGDAEIPVIFVTAYPEQLLTGLRPEPTFLIPKPFQHDTLKAVISQALFFEMNAHARQRLAS